MMTTSLPTRTETPSSRTRDPRVVRRLWLASSLVVVFLAASSAPTPLYEHYERTWHTTALVATIAFAVYALAVLAGLLSLGQLSMVVGRRPVVLAAIGLQIVALLLFSTAGSFAPIMLGRVLQGLATGAALGILGAIMIDADQPKGTIANAASPGAGTGGGALLSGLIVQFLPWPAHLVYLVLVAVLVLQGLATIALLDRGSRAATGSGVLASLRPRISVPGHARPAFRAAAPVVFAVWALAGLYGSLGPALFHRLAHDTSIALGALGLFLLAGVASLTTIVLRSATARAAMTAGTLALLAGLAMTVIAVELGSGPLYLVATAVAGVGFGSGFQGGIRTVLASTQPDERTGLLSAVYLVAYLGMGIPAVAAGAAVTRGAQLTTVAVVVAAALAALVALVATVGTRTTGRTA